jgi:hypothetical protein
VEWEKNFLVIGGIWLVMVMVMVMVVRLEVSL